MSDPLHPDLAFLRRVPWFSIHPRALWLFRAVLGRGMRTPHGAGIAVRDVEIDGAGGRVPIRVYRPAEASAPLPVLVWLHGGGLILGDHREGVRCARYARLGVAVVSVGYRLAPEHPFPAAHEDALAATRWALSGPAEHALDPGRVCVGGQSAGAGLAAALAQRLHDDGVQIAGQLLIYPMLDDRTAARTDLGVRAHWLWSNGSNRTGWSSYLGGPPGAAEVPRYASPGRRQDLSGLAPAWIGTGTLDLFDDEIVRYAERLRAGGVSCRLERIEGAVHGFDQLAPRAGITTRFEASQEAFLREALGLAEAP